VNTSWDVPYLIKLNASVTRHALHFGVCVTRHTAKSEQCAKQVKLVTQRPLALPQPSFARSRWTDLILTEEVLTVTHVAQLHCDFGQYAVLLARTCQYLHSNTAARRYVF
jgi:hypothetical protein